MIILLILSTGAAFLAGLFLGSMLVIREYAAAELFEQIEDENDSEHDE